MIRKPLVVISGQVQEIPAGDSVAVTYNGGVDPIIASFSGNVVVVTGASRYYHPSTTTISKVYASLGTVSSSGSVTAAVKLNGSTIATPTLASGVFRSADITLTQAITANDYITIDVTSAGTGAADLTIYLVVAAAGDTGQTWQSFTIGTDRVSGTTYTNSTGRPIMVWARAISNTAGALSVDVVIAGVAMPSATHYVINASYTASNCFIVPAGATYSCTAGGSGSPTLNMWQELR